ncbi:hypothetical protein JWV37_10365 [Sulfurospirillum sp. T05]|uniref:DUF2383 domain-containing protein n=1 Tax=Sulfurospirillum tamanense TaxID=2813362 RepID=A0ABS2WU68_9BACT|nr:hypothetical protein [Sulfurospirillum tamanensis]MBN2965185.1 hypothetical protein [Sulfurospirillum tamanensis]
MSANPQNQLAQDYQEYCDLLKDYEKAISDVNNFHFSSSTGNYTLDEKEAFFKLLANQRRAHEALLNNFLTRA